MICHFLLECKCYECQQQYDVGSGMSVCGVLIEYFLLSAWLNCKNRTVRRTSKVLKAGRSDGLEQWICSFVDLSERWNASVPVSELQVCASPYIAKKWKKPSLVFGICWQHSVDKQKYLSLRWRLTSSGVVIISDVTTCIYLRQVSVIFPCLRGRSSTCCVVLASCHFCF